MPNKIFIHKTRTLVLLAFLCVSTVSLYMLSLAYANPEVVASGTYGTCKWKYEQTNGELTLTIEPTNGSEGVLPKPVPPPDDFLADALFPWNQGQGAGGREFNKEAKHVFVKGKVKVESTAEAMFSGFENALSIDVKGLDVSNATNMKEMFRDCEALSTLDVSSWNVSKAKDMSSMFYGCQSLTELDVSKWHTAPQASMKGMFGKLTTLEKITLGTGFSITDDAFDDPETSETAKWVQINRSDGGTPEDPKGKVFKSCSELSAFHRDRTKRKADVEEYMRLITLTYTKAKKAPASLTLSRQVEDVTPHGTPQGCEVTGVASDKRIKWTVKKGGNEFASYWSHIGTKLSAKDIKDASEKNDVLVSTTFKVGLADEPQDETFTITFDANASGASVVGLPQALTVGEGKEAAVPSTILTREGKSFIGWNTKQDGSGTFYKAGGKIKNVTADMKLYAQWEDMVTLTYAKKSAAESGLTFSHNSETLAVSGAPSGCEVIGVPSGKTIKWTVTSGGNDNASTWSRTKTELEKTDIDAAAKKDGELVSTTFTAELVTKTYMITFDGNGDLFGYEVVSGVPKALSVEHGKEATVPSATLTWKGKLFTGKWNTKDDGSGTSYKAGEKIKDVTTDITLYAQWEDAITLTYAKKGTAESHLTLSRSSETLSVSGAPSGCEITGFASGETIMWTVTKGGNGKAWSRTKTKLEKDDIEAAAKKDGKLVSTTFTAAVVGSSKVTHTITFDANASGANVGALPQALTVEHGQETTAPSATLTWAGKLFTGRWNTKQDGSGTPYKAGDKIKDVVANMTLYAQWEDAITLTYAKRGEAESGLTFSRSSETLGVSGVPSGCEVTGVALGKKLTWTVTSGGNSSASTWSRTKTKLEKADIEAAAKKDGKLVSTTFTATLTNMVYTITFDANASGANVGTLPQALTVEHGQETTAPSATLTWEGKSFTGRWNTKQDGSGTPYKAGEKIKDVTANMTLYAQWEDAITLTYAKRGEAESGLTLSRSSETLGVSGTPSGCEVTGVALGKKLTWTVTSGGNSSASTWSRTKTKLEKADIEAAAKKDGKLVSTTFTATLTNKTYTITFDANASGANVGELPQALTVEHGQETTAPSATLTWEGKSFTGRWNTKQDGSGTPYKAGDKIKNVIANMTLYAQWEGMIVLTYAKRGEAESGLTLSRSSETLAVGGTPSGCEVTGVAVGKKLTWTVTSGGNSSASTWSRTKTKLEKADIEAAAKKDGKLVSTTFTATLTNKTYTITFDTNASGANVGALPQPLTVEHGQETTAPSATLTWQGKLFTGRWNTKQDGSGTPYKAGDKIKDVTTNMTLYAQWEDAITLTYAKRGEAESGLTLSRSSETLGVSGTPSGCEVTGVALGKKLTWTVTSGGNSSASTWSRTKTKLEKADIEAAAKKDGKLVSTTFTATLTNKTYTITFDANASGADVGALPQALTVEHGQETTAPSATLTWEGKSFTGRWNTKQDGSGTPYKAGDKIKNVVANMTLYAQWEGMIVLTYAKRGEAESGLTFSRSSETLAVGGTPSGCEVTGVALGKKLTWTVTSGGNSSASTWSRTKTKLEKADIEAAAKKDGKLVSTTFTATLTNTTYTITFDANASGADVGALPQPLTVEHGQETTAPSATLTWQGKLFTGRWNTKQDGSGTPYKAGDKIKDVTTNMTLYAQWEDAITLTYAKRGEAESGLTLSRSSETLGVSGTPSGCEVTGVALGKKLTWTVTSGGNSSASTWSRTKTKLEKADIEAAAKKDGKLVSTTFTATLTNKTYTITFDANASGADVGALPQALTVEHGQETTAPSATLTWEGKSFTGRWNTKQDGSGTPYKAGDKIKDVTTNMTLYAQWEDAVIPTRKESESTEESEPADKWVSPKESSCVWQKQYGQIFYLKDGKKLTGWQYLSGNPTAPSSAAKNWFYFDDKGAMFTGRCRLAGGKPNVQGKIQEHWFYFDKKTGAEIRGWVRDERGVWYYYSEEDGAGLIGRHEVEGGAGGGKHWFCFDECGVQIRGWSCIGTTWYYYSKEDGVGLTGRHEVEGGAGGGKHWFYFDEKTGAQIRGWKYIDRQNKWCYYSKDDGALYKGRHVIDGMPYYFDEKTGARS